MTTKKTKAQLIAENKKLKQKLARLEKTAKQAQRDAFWAADDAETDRTYHSDSEYGRC